MALSIPDSYVNGFMGGCLIGLAAVIFFVLNGRIMGVSGICSNLLGKPSQDFGWRAAFLFGLVAGGWVWSQFSPVEVVVEASGLILVLAGLLVGFGTVIGSGCTSGHGICGMARFSKRSFVATAVFMFAGMVTVWLRRVLGF